MKRLDLGLHVTYRLTRAIDPHDPQFIRAFVGEVGVMGLVHVHANKGRTYSIDAGEKSIYGRSYGRGGSAQSLGSPAAKQQASSSGGVFAAKAQNRSRRGHT